MPLKKSKHLNSNFDEGDLCPKYVIFFKSLEPPIPFFTLRSEEFFKSKTIFLHLKSKTESIIELILFANKVQSCCVWVSHYNLLLWQIDSRLVSQLSDDWLPISVWITACRWSGCIGNHSVQKSDKNHCVWTFRCCSTGKNGFKTIVCCIIVPY